MPQTFSNVLIHVIFSTKDRRLLIRESFRDRLWSYMAGLAKGEFGLAHAIGGTENHVHGLLSIRPAVSIATAMEHWKSRSSGWVRRTIPEARDFSWQNGYAAFSVSESNAAAVSRYIGRQMNHHRRRTFEEELAEFLKRHKVPHDPERLFG